MTEINVLGMTREYGEGWDAYSHQIGRDGNPYASDPRSAACFAWLRGWDSHEDAAADNETDVERDDSPEWLK